MKRSAEATELPEGWEQRIVDGRPLFVDHINKKTTWEDPRVQQRPSKTFAVESSEQWAESTGQWSGSSGQWSGSAGSPGQWSGQWSGSAGQWSGSAGNSGQWPGSSGQWEPEQAEQTQQTQSWSPSPGPPQRMPSAYPTYGSSGAGGYPGSAAPSRGVSTQQYAPRATSAPLRQPPVSQHAPYGQGHAPMGSRTFAPQRTPSAQPLGAAAVRGGAYAQGSAAPLGTSAAYPSAGTALAAHDFEVQGEGEGWREAFQKEHHYDEIRKLIGEEQSKPGSEEVFQRCRAGVEDVRGAGLLSLCLEGDPAIDDSASKMEWVGDAALILEVRRAIAEIHTDLEDQDMSRLAETCISNKSLAGLYDRLRMHELMRPGPTLSNLQTQPQHALVL